MLAQELRSKNNALVLTFALGHNLHPVGGDVRLLFQFCFEATYSTRRDEVESEFFLSPLDI